MVFRDRQGLSPLPPPGDPVPSANNRDRYLDNCFLLCINSDDDTNTPEIHRLENHLIRELCSKNQTKSQQQSRLYLADQRNGQNYEIDDDDIPSPRQQERDYRYRRKGNQQDRDSQTRTNHSRYPRDDRTDNYQYSRRARYNPRDDDYNIMQHSDDELSVYEVYVPTNTLNRLSDKRIDNNMVLIDYEDASMGRDKRPVLSPYGYSPRNITPQYPNYAPSNQYNNYGPQYDSSSGFPRERDGLQQQQQQLYQNNPLQSQQRLGGYYVNEGDRQPYLPQPAPFPAATIPIDHSNAINIRRHIYSPSQLPQGLTEAQLVMLLQRGSQYQPGKTQLPEQQQQQQTQIFSSQKEPQPSTTSAVTVSHQQPPILNTYSEPFKNAEYVPSPQINIPQVPPQIINHRVTDDNEKTSVNEEITVPMSTLHTTKPSRDIEFRESGEKKKDKTSDVKKDKKAEKDADESGKKDSKKDGKKEKSSGKESKKKKK